jgi:recombination protein RecR
VLPGPLDALIEQFRKLPGVGAKSAQRLAFHVLKTPREDTERLIEAIRQKDNVTYLVCHNITDVDPCRYCGDETRPAAHLRGREPQGVNVIEVARLPRRLSRARARFRRSGHRPGHLMIKGC